MDFSLSEEQTLLRDSVRKFVEKGYDFEARRKLAQSELGFSREHMSSFADLGWTSIPFSEADGGLGGTAVDTMVVMEELGRGLVTEPYFPSVVFAGGLLRRASSALKAQHLPGLMAADRLAAVAYAELGARFDLFHVEMRAQKTVSGYLIDGTKIGVLGGPSANVLLVTARTSGNTRDRQGITLFAVDAASAGVTRKNYPTVDGLRGADVTFQNVEVDASCVIGEVGEGLALLEAAVDEAIIALGAEAVGIMEVLYKSTLAYVKERRQFGVPIGSFQVLQHRIVDMFMEYEQMKSMVLMATMAIDSGQDVAKAAAALKVQLGKAGRTIGQSAIQVHGGMGMTDELPVSHYFKRLTTLDMTFGNADHHLSRYMTLSA